VPICTLLSQYSSRYLDHNRAWGVTRCNGSPWPPHSLQNRGVSSNDYFAPDCDLRATLRRAPGVLARHTLDRPSSAWRCALLDPPQCATSKLVRCRHLCDGSYPAMRCAHNSCAADGRYIDQRRDDHAETASIRRSVRYGERRSRSSRALCLVRRRAPYCIPGVSRNW
jgi:hypothetical protein